MAESSVRTIAYLCPACGQSVIAQRSVFQLAAAANELPCPCGKSSLRVELMGDRVKLTVPCLFCGESHMVLCPSQPFLHQRALAFSCSRSGLDCCYVGEEDAVFSAMRRLEEAAGKVTEEDRGAFLDEVVMQEVLGELKEIAQRGGISCQCGSGRWKMSIHYSSIDLTCADCGATARIPAATASDLEDICCKHTILLQKGR